MKKILNSLVIILVFAVTISTVPGFAESMKDIKGHWAESRIRDLNNDGYVTGYDDGNFRPNKEITRAEFIVILNRVLKLKGEKEINFTDVTDKEWFYKDLSIAIYNGYVKGFKDGTFRPKWKISRNEAAVMLNRIKDFKVKDSKSGIVRDFKEIPVWAQNSVAAIFENGIMTGYPDGTFKGNKYITRAEAVFVLDKVRKFKLDESIDKDKKEEEKKLEKEQTAPGVSLNPGAGIGIQSPGKPSNPPSQGSDEDKPKPEKPPVTPKPQVPSEPQKPGEDQGTESPGKPSDPPSQGSDEDKPKPEKPPVAPKPPAPGKEPEQPAPPTAGEQDKDRIAKTLWTSKNKNTTTYVENGELITVFWVNGIKAPDIKDFSKKVTGRNNMEYVEYMLAYQKGSGWYDINKTWGSNPDDSKLCSCATATNLLHWWLERNSDNIKKYFMINQNPENSPERFINSFYNQKNSGIFNMFKNMFGDGEKTLWADTVIDFFINGYKPKFTAGTNWEGNFQRDKRGGFFYEVFKEKRITDRMFSGSYNNFERAVKRILGEGKAFGVEHFTLAYGTNHIITVWGAEFNAKGNIKAIYVSDSDDDGDAEFCGMKKYLVKDYGGRVKIGTSTNPAVGSNVEYIHTLADGEEMWKAYFDKHEK